MVTPGRIPTSVSYWPHAQQSKGGYWVTSPSIVGLDYEAPEDPACSRPVSDATGSVTQLPLDRIPWKEYDSFGGMTAGLSPPGERAMRYSVEIVTPESDTIGKRVATYENFNSAYYRYINLFRAGKLVQVVEHKLRGDVAILSKYCVGE